MKKWLIKTDQHLVEVQEVLNGFYDIYDVDGNKLMYDEEPNYILEREFNKKRDVYIWYFYPNHFKLTREDYFYVEGNLNLQDMLKLIERECDVEVLKIVDIQYEIQN